jgi:hypothetical protein
VIEGRRALVVERRPPLEPTLDRLLAAMVISFRSPVRIMGWRPECSSQDHRFLLFAEGRHSGLDGHRRSLRLMQCRDCEGVQVRDITPDRLPGLPIGSLGVRRRDLVLGWYSGARRNQRTYGGTR